MDIPPALIQAIRHKEDVLLETHPDCAPRLVDAHQTELWQLNDFGDRAAFLFMDCLLEHHGYRLAPMRDTQEPTEGIARWHASDP